VRYEAISKPEAGDSSRQAMLRPHQSRTECAFRCGTRHTGGERAHCTLCCSRPR
jgi:hypothetical protein